jgi:ribosomal protein S12 methylthiotransferase
VKTEVASNVQPLSVGFVSLGCAKNLVDSQTMASILVAEDVALAPSPEEADIIIVNTCAFIEEAREEAVETILSACDLKQSGRCRAVLVAGCLPQRYGKGLQESLSDVDAFIGLDQLEEVGDIVRRLARGESGIFTASEQATRLYEPRSPGVVFSSGCYAYLKVAEGCNHRCFFCAIPMIRGRYRSRSIEQIVTEAQDLVRKGFRELDLVSQDVTAYGRDLADGTDLPRLVREIGKIDGQYWIRILYGYPSHVSDELLNVMSKIPQTCHYLDLPVQHSHPDILRAMGRHRTIEHVRSMSDRIRNAMPDAVLRTTCLVGFPGETDAHFEHLLAFVEQTEFDHLGVFVYSPEEKTLAFNLPDRPDAEVAEERRSRLLVAQKKIVDRKARLLTGIEVEVLLERRLEERDNVFLGRSRAQAPEADGTTLVEEVSADKQAGDFVTVRYTGQLDYDMKAVHIQV